jgi:multidrug transporter EmrE-like cation transporter
MSLVRQEPQPTFEESLELGRERALQSLRERTGREFDPDELKNQAVDFLAGNTAHYFAESLTLPPKLRDGLDQRKLAVSAYILSRVPYPLILILATAGGFAGTNNLTFRAYFAAGNLGLTKLAILLAFGMALLVIFKIANSRALYLYGKLLARVNSYESKRVAFNRLLFGGIDLLYANCLTKDLGILYVLQFPSSAPTLVETRSRSLHSTGDCRAVTDLLLEHESIAIGIVGPRGVGKTSMLEVIQDRAETAGHTTVSLPVPAMYSEDSFLRALALRVSVRLSGKADSSFASSMLRWSDRNTARATIAVVVLCFSVALVAFGANFRDISKYVNAFTLMGGIGIVVSLLAVFYLLVGGLDQGRHLKRFSRGVERSAHLLCEDLMYSWEVTNGAELSMTPVPFETKTSRSRSRKRRELSYIEVADRFREVLEENAKYAHSSPITILIDELDKLPSAKQRASLIVVLKDFLHIRNVRVVVTVASEAQQAFANRQFAAERTVYDTAFDEIVQIAETTVSDTCGILGGRVAGFPDGLALFCHCVGGGNPRDAIRVARGLLREGKRANAEFDLETSLRKLIRESWSLDGANKERSELADEVVALTLEQLDDDHWRVETSSTDFARADVLAARLKDLRAEAIKADAATTAGLTRNA